MLEGIQFVTDTTGKRTAVLLDLDLYGELWEGANRAHFYSV